MLPRRIHARLVHMNINVIARILFLIAITSLCHIKVKYGIKKT